jgi:gliding motility-associated-like protein
MRNFLVTFLLIIVACAAAVAQTDRLWVLGTSGLDMAQTPPAFFNAAFPTGGESNATVSDENGQLLFYTEGTVVWDRNHNIMPNSSALTEFGDYSTNSSSQGTCVVPVPQQPGVYYIFSLTAYELGANAGRLYYSKVDMSLNGGLGDLVPNEKGILLTTGLVEKLIAIPGTRCNAWVVVKSRSASEFFSFEITTNGVNHTPVVSPGGIINYNYYALGTLSSSPDYRKIVASAGHIGGGGLEQFDFNQATGQLSNPVLIDNTEPFYDACHSPDGTKLYGMNYYLSGYIYQYDLSAPNPTSTKTLIRQTPFGFDKIKLAMDGRVYFKSNYGSNGLDMITDPDLPGLACNYVPNAILFPGPLNGSLPNHTPKIVDAVYYSSTTHLSGPCWGVPFPISATEEGWDYTWGHGPNTKTVLADTPGMYIVSYNTPPCNYHVDTFIVHFPLGVLPDITASAACNGASNGKAYASTYPGDPVTYHYAWLRTGSNDTLSVSDQVHNLEPGTYRVFISTNTGCDTMLNWSVPEVDFKVSFNLSDTLACVGEAITLSNTSDPHFHSFQWDMGDGTSYSATDPVHHYADAGGYTITLIGIGDVCSDTISRSVTMDAPFPYYQFKKDKSQLCVGDALYLYPDSAATLTRLSWDFGDHQGFTGDWSQEIMHSYDEAGQMALYLKASFRACPDQEVHDTIMVYALPKVSLGSDSVLCLGAAPIFLHNEFVQAGDAHFWSTGDTSYQLKVVHPGVYRLSVQSGPARCTGTESIVINKDCYVDIPNVFTPNGDGVNDYFFPRQLLSRSVARFSMQVMNRWGQVVFETSQINGRGWDGKFNGKDQPEGAYVYLIMVDFPDGSIPERYQGNVTLVR